MTRSGWFNIYDVADQTDQSLLVTNVLMFIGGGSGSTAGGIKVTTLAVLLLAILTELRGDEHVRIHRREISDTTVRVAVAVVAAGALVVLTSVVDFTVVTGKDLQTTLLESTSALGTVGLSNGITHSALVSSQWILAALMFVGRIGTISFAAGLATRHRPTRFRCLDERPIIG